MDQDQTNPMPQDGSTQTNGESRIPEAPPQRSANIGIVIAAIIVVGLLVLGGLYWWGAQIEQQRMTEEENTMMEGDPQTEALMMQDSSDEVDAIEDDLESTEFDDLDAELGQMEAELEAESEAGF